MCKSLSLVFLAQRILLHVTEWALMEIKLQIEAFMVCKEKATF